MSKQSLCRISVSGEALGVALAMILTGATCQAQNIIDGFGMTAGDGESIGVIRLGVHKDWEKRWFADSSWFLTGRWEAELGHWGDGGSADLSITPILQLKPSSADSKSHPFLEVGIGPHILAEDDMNDKKMGGNFHFGSHVGVGYRFGDQNNWELSYRLQHLSNAGIEDKNPGVEFHLIRLGYSFSDVK